MEWMPIETAPKDGTEVLLYTVEWAGEISGTERINRYEIGAFDNGKSDYPGDDWWSCVGGDAYATWCRASHWMPLPSPPAT